MKPNVPEHMPAQQKGYTIVELSIALVIIAILIVTGLSGVNSVLLSGKANQQIEDTSRGIAKLQSFVTTGTSAIAITTDAAKGMGIFPANRLTSTGVSNVFGGSEFVVGNSADINGVLTNYGAMYTLTGIPKQVCTDIASTLAGLSFSAWVSNSITKEQLTAPAGQVKQANGNLNIVAVGTNCNSADSVGMTFLLKP